MFISVIRRDLEKAIFLADVESKSLANPPVESWKGQDRYLSSPDLVAISAYLTAQSKLNVEPLLSISGWTLGLGWTGSYNSFKHTSGTAALTNSLAAIVGEIYVMVITITGRTAGSVTLAFGDSSTATISVTTTITFTSGATTALSITPTTDFNGTVSMSVSVSGSTIPLTGTTAAAMAAAIIAATVPAYTGGALATTPVRYDIRSATIITAGALGSPGLARATTAQIAAIQDLLAHHFVETDVLKKSFLNGNIHGYLSPTFNPDTHRGNLGQGTQTPFTPGQAILALADDGITLFTVAKPIITTAVVGGGALTIGGLPTVGMAAVHVVATTNRALTGEQTIDGVLTSTNRVLLTGQTNQKENGIWITAAGAWARPVGAGDMIAGAHVSSALISVDSGGTYLASTTWLCTAPSSADVVGTNNLTFTNTPCSFVGYGLYKTSVILLGKGAKRITQEQIIAGGGTIAATSIVIPAPVILGPVGSNTYGTIAATLTQVRVQVNDMLSNLFICTT
jgi:hypothetical protein